MVRPTRHPADGGTSMRRPSATPHSGVSRLTATPGSFRNAWVRPRFDAATVLWAIVSTLSELECIQPELGAERPPQLPGAIGTAGNVLVDKRVERRLREQV